MNRPSTAPILNYAHARVRPTRRYSGSVIASFIMALAVPLVAFQAGPSLFFTVPVWIVVGVPLAVFALNLAAAFHLLTLPTQILGDGLVSAGVFISGLALLAAMLFAMAAAA